MRKELPVKADMDTLKTPPLHPTLKSMPTPVTPTYLTILKSIDRPRSI